MTSTSHIVRKVRRSLERDGFVGMLALCVRNIREPTYTEPPSQFDLDYGVDTSGRIELGDLNIDSPTEIWGIGYAATPAVVFDAIMALLPPPEDYSFVDMGCGKGRVVLMASMRPFRTVVGVEFSTELCAIAETNLAKFRPHVRARDVRIVCQDGALFEFPAGSLIVFLFYPFTGKPLAAVVDRLAQRPDETIFIYLNVHDEELFTGFEILHADAKNALCIWRIPGKQAV